MAASVWFVVIVLVSMQEVFARLCSYPELISSCDECVRCGGTWCNKKEETPRCEIKPLYDAWCSGDKESAPSIMDSEQTGTFVHPLRSTTTMYINNPSSTKITYTSAIEQKVEITVMNATGNFDVKAGSTKCARGTCGFLVTAQADYEFCPQTGVAEVYVDVLVHIENVTEDVVLTYHVPCACACRDAKRDRGDIPINNCMNPMTNTECSGNGYCNKCTKSCECFIEPVGAQYFHRNYFCADICATTNECEKCLLNPVNGTCQEQCDPTIVFQAYNESLMAVKDDYERNVWINCEKYIGDECSIKYAAMMRDGDTYVMVISHCGPFALLPAASEVNITVPVVMGVIAVIATVAAVAGYMMWKNRAPPSLPLKDSHYHNIEPDDCVGVNPLYKPPTSSFTNPTYRKC